MSYLQFISNNAFFPKRSASIIFSNDLFTRRAEERLVYSGGLTNILNFSAAQIDYMVTETERELFIAQRDCVLNTFRAVCILMCTCWALNQGNIKNYVKISVFGIGLIFGGVSIKFAWNDYERINQARQLVVEARAFQRGRIS